VKKIKVGFVGAGWMGSVHLKRLSERNNAEILALCETNRERGKNILKELKLPQEILTDSYDDIITNESIDAVWLVSPNSFHGKQAIQAIEAGKHVFCEKPAATDIGDFYREIDTESASMSLKTFVDYILYFDPMEQKLIKMVESGEFGTVTQIQANYRHAVNITGDKTWKLKKGIVGDAIGMGIIHAISSIVFLMKSQSEPVSVYAKAMPSQVRGFEPEPVWTIIINFKNGATGTCLGNIDYGNGYDAYHNIFGTKGGFIFDSQQDNRAKVRYWAENTTGKHWIFPMDVQRCREEGFEELAWPNDMSMPDSGDVIEHQTGAAVDHFLNCIEKGKSSPLSFANSRIIAEIGWAAQISALTGKEVSLPLDREEALRILKYAPGAGRDSITDRNGIPSGGSIPGRNGRPGRTGSRGDIGGDV